MTASEPCVLYTQDPELTQRVRGFLRFVPNLKQIDDPGALKLALDQNEPALLLLDSRTEKFAQLVEEIRSVWPDSLTVVIGPRRSDPVVRAEAAGVFAVLEPETDGHTLKRIVQHAQAQLDLVRKVRVLREQLDARPPVAPAALPSATPISPLPLRHAFPPLRQFDDVNAMLQGTINEIVSAGVVLRAAAFVHEGETRVYRFAAGVGCSDDTARLRVPEDYPLVRWLEKNAQLVCRSELRHVVDTSKRLMLERALNQMQAELLVPLLGRSRIVGWILLGRLATGAPFTPSELQDVMILAERVSTALENAMLFKEAARQRTLAETLLHSVPTGIAAVKEDGRIYWFNEAAERMLNRDIKDVVGQPIEVLGSRLADRLRETLTGMAVDARATEWLDNASERHLSVQTVRLMDNSHCGGAVAFIHDLTRERMLNKRQREVDRSAFWTELAANMSHEIRNPLVAIKTFAQLLPERYQDDEFRNEFSVLVSQEVDRLNSLIEQINSFAEFPEPVFEPLNVEEPLQEGVKMARLRVFDEQVEIQSSIDKNLPKIRGDRRALTECFAHVITNSLEALKQKKHPKIILSAHTIQNGNAPRGVEITLSDNAGGIDPGIHEKIFSPFCTGRTAGMGLGLPIVQRTVSDHEGLVRVDSDTKGTQVTIVLPAQNATPEDIYETPVNR